MKSKDKYIYILLMMYFTVCFLGYDSAGTIKENYNTCFYAQTLALIFAGSYCVMLAGRLHMVREVPFLMRLKRKSDVIFFSTEEMIQTAVSFVFVTNVFAGISLLAFYGRQVVSADMGMFVFIGMLKQFWAWMLVGSIYVFAFILFGNESVAEILVILVISVFCMASSKVISFRKYLYNFPKTVITSPYDADYGTDIKHMLTNAGITVVFMLLTNVLNSRRQVYGN